MPFSTFLHVKLRVIQEENQIISFLKERACCRVSVVNSSTSSFIESNLSVTASTRSLNLFLRSLPLLEIVSRVSDPLAGANRRPTSNPVEKPIKNLFIVLFFKGLEDYSFPFISKYRAMLQKPGMKTFCNFIQS